MKRFFGATAILLFMGHAHAQNALCGSSQSVNNINAEIKAQESVGTQLGLKSIIRNKDLILAGEAHFHTSTKYLTELIRMFAHIKGKSACIAFEFSKRNYQFNEMLQNITRNIVLIKAELQSDNLDENTRAYYSQSLKIFTQIQDYYLPLNTTAVSEGLKTFTVDHKNHDFENQASYSDRNKAMAINLEELIVTKKCSSVLYFVGKAHLSTSLGTTDKIQDYLPPKVLERSLTLNIQMTRESSLPLAGRTWAGCKPLAPAKPIIFRSEIIEDSISVMPLLNEAMPRMVDYDFTYLLPNE